MSHHRIGRWVMLCAVVAPAGALVALGSEPVATATATPTPPSFTWTGQGTSVGGPDGSWSNAANWTSGAPVGSEAVGTLSFPALDATCDADTYACEQSDNDLSGLSASAVDFGAPGSIVGSTYSLTGDGFSLGSGGLTVAAPPEEGSNAAAIATPLTLLGNQTWSLGAETSTGLDAPVGATAGSGPSLTVGLGNASELAVTEPVEVGPVTLQAGKVDGSTIPLVELTPGVGPSDAAIDAADGAAVTAKGVALVAVGAVGALHATGTRLTVGTSRQLPGRLTADSVTLDAASQLDVDVDGTTPGTDYSQLLADPAASGQDPASSGAVALGGAALGVSFGTVPGSSACFEPSAGDSWPLVVAASLTGEVSVDGALVPDGGVVSVPGCVATPGGTPPAVELRLGYSATTLTATVLGIPSTTVAGTTPTTVVGGATVQFSATVTGDGTTAPGGTVVFTSGTTTLCTAALTTTTASGLSGTCTSAAAPDGVDQVLATYAPAAGSGYAGSSGTTVLDVDDVSPPPGAISYGYATSDTPGGTATATDGGLSATGIDGEGSIVVAIYGAPPGGHAAALKGTVLYFDVRLDPGATFTSLRVIAPVPPGGTVDWYDTATGTYLSAIGDPRLTPVPGRPGEASVTFTPATSPDLTQLGGTVFAAGLPIPTTTPPTPTPPHLPPGHPRPHPIPVGSRPPATTGYRMVATDGGVFSYGEPFYGSTGGIALVRPVVGMADAAGGKGYYLVASDGGIFSFGPGAHFHGSTGGIALDQPIVGMAVDPLTGGYWLVAADGGVFSFDAPYYGSTGGIALHQPIVGMAAAPDGRGYYLVARDGGIFTFGPGAEFRGSTGGIRLVQPVEGIAVDPATGGYWLVAADGGVFSFDAPFKGSTGGIALTRPVVAIEADAATGGYRIVASDGGVFSFASPFLGSTGGIRLVRPVVGASG